MASILRSAKFVRYVAGFARNIVINPPREFDGNLVQNTQCFCGGLQRSLATQANAQRPNDQSLERSLRRLDQDVRRSGRISRRDIEDILEEIRHTRSATSSQSLLVIRCCGNLVPEELPEVRTKLVQEIWNTLNKLNIPMDISHYNALLRVYLENEHPFSPTEFLTDLEAKGIEPNRVTYQRLIAQYCQLGDIEGATRILEFMREKQLPVNENVFNALIMGHSYTDDMESARGILSVMQQAGLEPSADTYTTLLCGYARKGDLDAIKSTLEECEPKEIYLLDKDYLDIIFSLATNGHESHVPYLLSKVKKSVGYNQDAINLILRLINCGKEEIAIEILKTIPPMERDGQVLATGNFFIKQMVKAKRPVEKIIDICKLLQEQELNPKALLLAAEMSLQMADANLAYPLLKELQSQGLTVKQHFFWPLLVARGKSKNQNGVFEILDKMNDFNLNASAETIREYVLPHVKGKADDLIDKLRNVGISLGTATISIIHKYLIENKINDAANLAKRINVYYPPQLLRRPLTMAYVHSKDLDSYVDIVREVHDNFERKEFIQRDDPNEDENTQRADKKDIVGHFVLDITYYSPKNMIENMEEVLNGLVKEGLSMSNSYAEKIQERLGEKLTPHISDLLGKMTSGELTLAPKEKIEPHYTPSSAMNIPQLERLIANLDAKGENTIRLKRQLLTLYTRAKELEKTENLLKSLENENFTYSTGVYAQLIDLYAHHEKFDEVMKLYQKIVELEPNSSIDDLKILKIANLMITNDKFDDAIQFLNQQTHRKADRSYNYSATVWRMLNSLAEKGETEKVYTLFDTLVKNDLVDVNNVILGPLIKVHLVNKDLNKAMEKFEWCVNQYKATPWKNELACKMIQNEDADNLQKLTDLSTVIHGEVNSLYDLVFAFVECGRIRQARKILETPGLQSRPQRLNTVCERYREEGSLKNLEGLREATKDLSYIDRSDIYYQLLLSYISKKDCDKALGLWTEMQEEDCPATDKFLIKLGNFLKQNNKEVPFIIPETVTEVTKSRKENVRPTEIKSPQVQNNLSLFRHALKNDVDQALQLKNSVANQINVNDYSALLENLVKQERQNEANKLCIEMLKKNLHPIPRVFRFLLNKIANNGDVQTIETIGNKLSSDMKKLVSFDNRLCHANIVAGKADQYLDTLVKEIENAKDEHVMILAEKFPRGGAVGILEKCPELSEKYESLAQKYAKRGVIAPMNVLWAHHFINENDETANRIWSSYLADTPRIMFQRVVQLARETKNETLIRRLISHLKNTKVTEGALGNAYSCLLDVLVQLEKHDETIQTFEQISSEVNTEYINRTALLRVKEIFEQSGKKFDFVIPAKKQSSTQTSSSSSSDDDKKR